MWIRVSPNFSSSSVLLTRDPSSAIEFWATQFSQKKKNEGKAYAQSYHFLDSRSSILIWAWLASSCSQSLSSAMQGQFKFKVFFNDRPVPENMLHPTQGMMEKQKIGKGRTEKKNPTLQKTRPKIQLDIPFKLYIITAVNLRITTF